jgi:hypothetical protein
VERIKVCVALSHRLIQLSLEGNEIIEIVSRTK